MTTTSFAAEPHLDKSSPISKPSVFTGASPKLTFVMGVVSGVAVISLIGFIFALSYGFKGNFKNNPSATNNVATGGTVPTQTNEPVALPSKVNITVKSDDHIRGPETAKVTLVEYSDFECPFCKRFHPAMQQLMQEYAGQVRWVYRHFPLSFHANAQKEAEAAECAGKLGGNEKFWEYTDKIFERTTSNGTGFALDALVPLAKELGLSESKFKSCLDGGEFAVHVQTDLQEGASLGVSGTPTTFVNGQPVEGAVPYEQLKQVVESLLK